MGIKNRKLCTINKARPERRKGTLRNTRFIMQQQFQYKQQQEKFRKNSKYIYIRIQKQRFQIEF